MILQIVGKIFPSCLKSATENEISETTAKVSIRFTPLKKKIQQYVLAYYEFMVMN